MTENIRNTYEWDKARKIVKKRDQYRCQGCGKTENDFQGVDLQVHHINPVDSGGSNDRENLVLVCNSCHWSIHREGPEDGRFPISLLDEVDSWKMLTGRRERMDYKKSDLAILDVLIENGPTELKEIIERSGYARTTVQSRLNSLQMCGTVGKIERGLYGYVPLPEFYRSEEGDGNTEICFFEPEKHEIVDDPR